MPPLPRLRSLLDRLRGLPPRTAGHDGRALGRAGERAAARLLRRAGYKILGRNVRLQIGEADLVCLAPDRTTIVIVEVKTRLVAAPTPHDGYRQPPPEASVHAHKRRKLAAVARSLARLNRWHDRPVRIDVVAVEWPPDGPPTLRHHVGAVRAEQTTK